MILLMTRGNKKLKRPMTYGERMSTVESTDAENPPTTNFVQAFKRSVQGWEKTCAAITMKKKRRVSTMDTTMRMTKLIGTLLPPASLS
jgi:hypothetical protein